MHGLLRPLLLRAKPWQRVFIGFGLVALGLTTGAITLAVLGAAVIFGTVYGGVRSRQALRLQASDASGDAATVQSI